MKSPFRRRRRRPKGRAAKARRAQRQQPTEPEVVDWPTEGTGKTSLMGSIRGDSESGAGFGAGMFEDLHAAFSGSKKVQIEEREAERMRRQDERRQGDTPDPPGRNAGVIRVRRDTPDAPSAPDAPDAPADQPDD